MIRPLASFTQPSKTISPKVDSPSKVKETEEEAVARLDTVAIHKPTLVERGTSLLRSGTWRQSQVTLKFPKFAASYLPAMEKKLGTSIPRPANDKMAARAILDATALCCKMLGPAAAVALAREVAQGLIPKNGPEENALEQTLLGNEAVKLRDQIYVVSVEKPTPAAASTQNVILTPLFVLTASKESGLAAIGHELSHIEHRDVVGNFGDATLKCALAAAADSTFNPWTWALSDQTLSQIKLASATASREREYRCDRESVESLLKANQSKEFISKGFEELFSAKQGNPDPLDDHPPNLDRLTAIKRALAN